MHVLFSSLPSHGHTYPLLPLAIAAKEHGHRVTYATDTSFHPVLVSLGFDVVDVGTTITDTSNQVTQGTPPDFGDVEAMGEQLFIPQGADQFVNTDAVTEGGAGLQLVGDAIAVEAVAANASNLLADKAVA